MKAPALLTVAFLLALAPAAHAGEARTYFDIGAKAYEAGRYMDAVRAFKEAYRLSKRPGLLFSLGQANRMEFFARSDPARLRDAVHYYKLYVSQVQSGHHRRDATAALATLEPMLANMGAANAAGSSGSAKPSVPRVMISTATEGGRILIDGKSVSDPFTGKLEPGKHRVVISAPGYQDYQREIVVDAKTGAPPLDIALKPKPARLSVSAPDGADVSIDGRLEGETPLPPLSLPAGVHFVAVTLNGHEPFSRRVTLGRGEAKTVAADLHVTGQRTASWVLIGAGAAGVVAGGVLGYIALEKQSDARSIEAADTSQGNLPPSELAHYNALRTQRDNYRLASVVTLGGGIGLAALGVVLRAFDQPKAPLPPLEQTIPGQKQPRSAPTFEISAAPLWQPGLHGAFVQGSF